MKAATPFPIVAIDGPAGAGKSTLAKKLAERLGFSLLNTGSIYRALAYHLIDQKIPKEDILLAAQKAHDLEVKFESQKGSKELIFINGKEISSQLNSPLVSEVASFIAAHQEIREALLPIQKQLVTGPCVIEGRDIGTTLFPNATVKFFVTASAQVRATRRFLELQQKIPSLQFSEVLEQQQKRDQADSQRSFSPLIMAQDAILIDSSNMSIEELVNKMVVLCQNKIPQV